MKKTGLLFVAALLSAVMLFTACNSGGVVSKLKLPENLAEYLVVKQNVKETVDLPELQGYDFTGNLGNSLRFSKTESGNMTTGLYFYKSGVLRTFAETGGMSWSFDYNIYVSGGEERYIITAESESSDSREKIYYDDLGNEFFRTTGLASLSVKEQIIDVSGNIFFAESSGKITANPYSLSDDAVIPDGTVSDKYIYDYSDENLKAYERNFSSYDNYKKLEFASYANIGWFILGDGNVLVQEIITEPPAESGYDYIDKRGTKYSLKSYIWDIGQSEDEPEIRELDLNFIIDTCLNKFTVSDFGKTYTDKAENVAYVYAIENERLLDHKSLIVLGNDGKGVCRLDAEAVFGPAKGNYILNIGENRWTFTDNLGYAYIIDNEGNVISKTNSASVTGGLTEIGGFIYNADLTEQLYNLADNGAAVVENFGDYVILRKIVDLGGDRETKYYIYDGSESEIVGYDSYDSYGYYTLTDGVYSFLTGRERVLFTSTAKATFSTYGDCTLVRYTDSSSMQYSYKIII